jgi:hypothetical protein
MTVYCFTSQLRNNSNDAACTILGSDQSATIVQLPRQFHSHCRQKSARDKKKAHHRVRSNLPRFRLLGSASNIL